MSKEIAYPRALVLSPPVYLRYLQLTKPKLMLMALVTTFSGFYLASNSRLNLNLLVHALVGSALVGGGANALNQYYERHQDRKMLRTQGRPIPGGLLEARNARIF